MARTKLAAVISLLAAYSVVTACKTTVPAPKPRGSPTPISAANPQGYSGFRNDTLGISFAYPALWSLEIDCGSAGAHVTRQPGGCAVLLTTPDSVDIPGTDCVLDEPGRTTRIFVGEQPSREVMATGACASRLEGSPLFGSVYHWGVRQYSSCGYAGFGDGAEACLTDGKGRWALVQMNPPGGKEDPELNAIVRSFRFTD